MNSRMSRVPLHGMDLPRLGFFLGLRFDELVMQRMHAAGFRGLRHSHGFVIQHLIERDRSVTELARRMGVTQQAASKVVAELMRLGVVESIVGQDRRVKQVHLSAKGWQAVNRARRIRQRLETRLITTIGKQRYQAAKSAALSCLEELGGLEAIHSRRIRQLQ